MDSVADDPRFSHVVTDPRFRPMPKTKRKVKIDKRFDALFKSKHFKTRTDIDKRGKPVIDVSKRNKHVMQRFYELSSGDSNSESEDEDEDAVSGPGETERREEDDPDVRRDKLTNHEDSLIMSKSKKRKLSKSETNVSNDHKQEAKKSKKMTLSSTPPPAPNDRDDDDEGSIDDFHSSNENEDNEVEDDSDSSDSDDSSDGDGEKSDDDDEDLPEYTGDHDLVETGIEHKWSELHKDAEDVSESTHRLAVCNMDWDFVKAQDLFVLLKSFVPGGGRVKSVTIYPSQYGKERMTEEALLGPKEMRDMVEGVTPKEDPDESNKKKKRRRKNPPLDQKQQQLQDKGIKKHETEKLREYQLNRLRYYYAVVDCDSVETADSIYNECDGKEYQMSYVQLDLRYIPDDMTFDDEPKESFSEEQGLVDYVPKRFYSTALSQAKVDVTWDETDFDRLSRRVVGLQRKELESMVEENQHADLIAPPESDSEVENDRPDWLNDALAEEEDTSDEELTEEKKINMYRKVLMDKLAGEKEAEEGDVDQEIQWTPGLKSSAQEKLKKKKKDKDTQNDIVEGYLEKKRQKKKRKLEEKKREISAVVNDDVTFSDDDLPSDVDDSLKEMMESEGVSVSKKSRKGKKKGKKEENATEDSETEREKAELELLMMGDGEMSISKPKSVEEGGKMSKKKKKKMAKLAKEKKEKEKQDFSLNMEGDDRFNALFTSHHFHIDPNAPQFKKTQNMVQLVDEQISRKKRQKPKGNVATNTTIEEPNSKLVSKQLVESLKRKMKKK